MVYLLGQTTVEDFGAWQSSFVDNDSFRSEHGQTGYHVFQSIEDPNEVTVLFEWTDGEDPRAFFQSEEMRERLADAGVIGQPEFSALKLVTQTSSLEPSA